MLQAYWVKRALCLGTALTLTMTGSVTLEDATASTLCRETEMAGISLSLDKYYTSTYAVTDTADITESAEDITTAATESTEEDTTFSATSGSAVATAKPTTKPTSKPEKKTEKKKDNVSKRFQTLGISVAGDYVNVRKTASTDSKVMGKLYEGSAAKILATKGGWVKIESGDVTGYINKDFLAIGAAAQKAADKYGVKYASVKHGVITLNVRAKNSTDSTILTQIPEDEEYNVVRETESWAKISIDDGTEGFVAKEFVDMSVNFKHAISIKEEKAKIARQKAAEKAEKERLAELAREKAAAKATQSSSSSSSNSSSNSSSKSNSTSSSSKLSSSKSSNSTKSSSSSSNKSNSTSSSSKSNGSSSSSSSSNSSGSSSSYSGSGTGSEIASYAQKFVGNPYVYGGTSLTRGTDCSGFTMSIYAQFGYSIPRTSRAQSGYSTSVSLSNVKAGDLIFYKNGSSVGHVAMYIGGGRVVHASNPTDGIKISNMYYRQPCNARRIVG